MPYRTNVLVCAGTGCVSGNSFGVAHALENEIRKLGLEQEVQVIRTGCQGFCAEGPIVIVQPDGIFYCGVQQRDAVYIAQEHLLKGRPVKKLLYSPPAEKTPDTGPEGHPLLCEAEAGRAPQSRRHRSRAGSMTTSPWTDTRPWSKP